MKKNVFLIVISICFIWSITVCFAIETSDGLFDYEIDYDENNNRYLILTDYNGDGTNVIIPATIDVSFPNNGSMHTPVKKIQGGAFRWDDAIENITIPNSIHTIDGGAFE